MAKTAIATLQPIWDCRWSRPGYRLTGVSDALQPENRWVCVREGVRRNVTAEECETCPHWELGAEGVVSAVAPAMALAPVVLPNRVPILAAWTTRALMVIIALAFLATGFVVLNSPPSIPFTIGLWLCAATLVGFAVFGRWPDRFGRWPDR